jgi:valyl-tRNA synthetase
MEIAKSIISSVRQIRNTKHISPKDALELNVINADVDAKYIEMITKMANLTAVNRATQKPDGAASFMVGTTEFAVPLGSFIDVEAEKQKIEAELKHLQGFLAGIQKKLSNEKFVANAPAQVVEMERKKQSDAESKIAALTEALSKLK